MAYSLFELIDKKEPFSVIISDEMDRPIYFKLYRHQIIQCEEMKPKEITLFIEIRKKMKLINANKYGEIWEYNNFKREMPSSMKHNFLVRNKIIKDKFI